LAMIKVKDRLKTEGTILRRRNGKNSRCRVAKLERNLSNTADLSRDMHIRRREVCIIGSESNW
jgi:hypothetical protein